MAPDKPDDHGDTPDSVDPEGTKVAQDEDLENLEEEEGEEGEEEEFEYGEEDEDAGEGVDDDLERGYEGDEPDEEEEEEEPAPRSGILGRMFSRKKSDDSDDDEESDEESDREEDSLDSLDEDSEGDEGEEEPAKPSAISRMFSRKRSKDAEPEEEESLEEDGSDTDGDLGLEGLESLEEEQEEQDSGDGLEEEQDSEDEPEEKPSRGRMFGKVLSFRKKKGQEEEEGEEEQDSGDEPEDSLESGDSEGESGEESVVFEEDADEEEGSRTEEEDEIDDAVDEEVDEEVDEDDSDSEPGVLPGILEEEQELEDDEEDSDGEPAKSSLFSRIFSRKSKGSHEDDGDDSKDQDSEPSVSKLAAIAGSLSLRRKRKDAPAGGDAQDSEGASGKVEVFVNKLLKSKDSSDDGSASKVPLWNALSQIFRRPMGLPDLRWTAKGRSSLLEVSGQKFATGMFWSLETYDLPMAKKESRNAIVSQIKQFKDLMKSQGVGKSDDPAPTQDEFDDLYAFSRVEADSSGVDQYQYGKGSSWSGLRPMLPSLGSCMANFLQEALHNLRRQGTRYNSVVAAFEVPSLKSDGNMVGNGYYLIAIDNNGCILPDSDHCLRSSKHAKTWVERFRHQNPNSYLIAPAGLGIPNSVTLDLEECFHAEDFCLEEGHTRLRGVNYALFRSIVYGFFGMCALLVLMIGSGVYDSYQTAQDNKERQERNVQLQGIRQVQDRLSDLQAELASSDLELLDIRTAPWASSVPLLDSKYFLENCFKGILGVNLSQAPLGLRFLNLYCNLDSSGRQFEVGVNWGSLLRGSTDLSKDLDLSDARGSGVLSRWPVNFEEGAVENLTPLREEWDDPGSRLISSSGLFGQEEALKEVEWVDFLKSVEKIYDSATEEYPDLEWSRDQATLGQASNGRVIWVQAGGSFTSPPLGPAGIVAISSLLGGLSGFIVEAVNLNISSGDWKVSGWIGVETPAYSEVSRDLRSRSVKRSSLEAEIAELEVRLRELEAEEQ